MKRLEVALLEWGEREPGENTVKLLGRSSDPALVETVRAHLVGRLSGPLDEPPGLAGPVRRLQPAPNPDSKKDEGAL